MLAIESQQVIAMRSAVLARGGPGASRETHRMITEKVAAAANASVKLAQGASMESIVADYRKKVRSNRTRLFRKPT